MTVGTGAPPFDVAGVALLIYGLEPHNKRHWRCTPEAMVKDGLLEKSTSYEQRRNKTQYGGRCKTSRYGLPGQCAVVRDHDGKNDAIDGECVRLP